MLGFGILVIKDHQQDEEFTSVNHPGPPLRAINSRVNAGLRGMAKICLKIK